MRSELKDKAAAFPKAPGVYLFKDDKARVLYIGKAKSLRDRVGSYLSTPVHPDPRIEGMLEAASDIEYLLTGSEVEALLLENRLIKDIQPRFNRMLRDGKTYPHLAISNKDDFATVAVTRDITREGYDYLGPFVDPSGLRTALALLQRIFKFRTCEMEIRESDPKLKHFRPCLLHHIDRCTAPCNLRISKADYAASIEAFRRILAGQRQGLTEEWERAMKAASDAREYEQAAIYQQILSYRRYPDDVFTGSPERLQALKAAISWGQ